MWAKSNRAAFLCSAGLLMATCGAAQAVVHGQVDTFQGSAPANLFGWQNGQGTPAIVAAGGPGGDGNSYMQMTALGGVGAGSKMTLFNGSQWTGNYAGAGVGEIQMQLKNLSSIPLTMRVVLKADASFAPGWCSTAGVVVPNDGAWHFATFPLDAGNLTAVNGPPALATVLGGVGELRIIASASPAISGDAVAGSVGIADITAVPEPAVLTLMGLGALGFLGRRRSA